MRIRVCQGERPIAEDNYMLNEFTIYGLPMKFAQEVEVLITMDIDNNGMLTVSAKEFTTGVEASIVIGNEMQNLTTVQISESIAKSEQMKRNDEIRKARIEARNKLEWSAYELKRCMNREYCKMDHPVYLPEEVLQLTRKIKKWLDENPNATKAMIESQYDHLMNFKQQKGL
ncbi:hsp70-like protein [Leptotrombidium deliense]|uniref:Hsp70-like protein n=1 Tax=Leptotrombidium deliense TaxID=299467 RepID=A0A443RYB1_9ACAR|nr:hsp70-like protein [Leptotrombidium deliense]